MLAALSIAALVGAGVSRAQEALDTEHALQQFDERVGAYVALRTRVAASVPPIEVLPDAARIHRQVDALAEAIRAARDRARRGDVFTPEVRLVVRMEIRHALADARIAVEDLMDEFTADASPRTETPPVNVNGPFPWAFGSAMPPVLLDVLPALPVELQYRFIGRDLMLVDVDANLVVDILPDALPLGRSADLSLCRL